MIIKKLFPDTLLIDQASNKELENIKKEIKAKEKEINALVQADTWGDNISTTFSSCDNIIDKLSLINTKQFIELRVKEYINLFDYYIKKDIKTLLKNSWINFNKKYSYQDVHTHDEINHYISGVMYIETNGSDGNIEFIPNFNTLCIKRPYAEKPVPGKIIIFHGYMPHRVQYNKFDTTRISISFNYSFI